MPYLSVCRYFIDNQGDCDNKDLLKLMKLVYITHGLFLAIIGSSFLEKDSFQAWTYGPVLPDLYNRYKGYNNYEDKDIDSFVTNEILTADKFDDARFIPILEIINERYSKLKPFALVELTHQVNSPWDIYYIRGEKVTIPDKVIKEHYERLLEAM